MKIDISGPQGNAFSIMSIAECMGRQLNRPEDEIRKINDQMMSGDYTNVLRVFNREYGSVVDLYDSGKKITFIKRKKIIPE